MPSKVWDEINYSFPNINGCTNEVWECICNFIIHLIMDVITYPLGLKLIHVNNDGMIGGGGHGIFQHQHQKGIRLFVILSTYFLVCFSEHWYSYAPGCSAFYTTVDASRSYCDSFSVLDGLECFYCMTKKALWWLSTIFHRDWYVFYSFHGC